MVELLEHASYAGDRTGRAARGERTAEAVQGEAGVVLADAQDGTVLTFLEDAHLGQVGGLATALRAARDEGVDALYLADGAIRYRLQREGNEDRAGLEALVQRLATIAEGWTMAVIIESRWPAGVPA